MVCPESVSLLLLQIFGAVNMFFRRDLFLAALQPSYRPDRWVASAYPIWLGVGGTPQSFARAGALGLPLMVAIIGGDFHRFRPLVDLYRETGRRAGHAPDVLTVGVHALGFVGDTDDAAKDAFFPGWAYMFTEIGRERGWSTVTRPQFEAMCSSRGAFLIGSPKTVRDKILDANTALGGVSRITFQMSSAMLETEAMQRSVELLGSEVAPAVKAALRQEKIRG
jgi:alkanesulfonate monooxygenase SsuD/methylene tetrahydromethanopterin reductase-like flavin-dependent oxidoreductase (luciferase family)